MKRIFFIVSLVLLACTASLPLSAKVRLPRLVSDRMVLQRDTELKIWGWASPGEKVTVRFRGKHYNTEADAKGNWLVLLPPQQAGGPFLLEVNELAIRDVLVGDVWLCSGQSNQETPIARLTEMFPEINVSNNHMIRHYKVPTQNSVGELKDEIAGNAGWYSGIASDVLNWTSLAYFFAQEAYNKYKVPVGMLVSSLGGSAIESWISQEHLKTFPELCFDKAALDSMKLAQQDKGAGSWQQKKFDDTDWATMDVPGYWQENGIRIKGTIWYRKEFRVPESMVGRHARLYMGRMVDSDSVFVNGTFVGFTSYTYPPRKYDIPAGVLTQGENVIAVRLTANSSNGGFVKDKKYKIVGDDAEVDLTGTWKYKIGINQNEVMKYAGKLKNLKKAGSGLYNGMIHPISNYQVKGAIWYQGESNSGRSQTYASLLEALIQNWRELWKMPDMPFLLVQLPNYMEKSDKPSDSGWARIREAQFKTALNVPHTALAVTYDVGEWNDIHPLNKKAVAQRLFLGARRLVYGEKVTASGPLYKEMKVEGDKIILTFTETGRGLTCKGKELKHFAIAGEDRKFVWADAVIRGNKVVVSSELVKNPVAVRYAWSNNPEDANLCNKEGLLASPFRTDIGNKLFENYYLNNNYKLRTNMKNRKTLLAVLASLALSSCTTRVTTENDASLKGVLGDKFLVGVALNTRQSSGVDTAAVKIVKRHFNSVVAENCMKCQTIHPEEDRYDFSQADEFVKFGEDNGMYIIGHCLVWHSQLAPWLCVDKDGNNVAPEVLKQRLKDHITTIVSRYKGRVKGWDVVNEAILEDGSYRKSKFYEILGEEFIPLAFQYAHEADPEAELYYNDYNMHEAGKRATVVKLVNDMKSKGLRVDAIGMQGHVGLDYPSLTDFEESMLAYASTGAKVMITEWDMSALPTLKRTANVSDTVAYKKMLNPYPESLPDSVSQQWNNRMSDFLNLFIKHSDFVSRVTAWGVSDGDSWKNGFPVRGRKDYALLFDRDYQPKDFIKKILE